MKHTSNGSANKFVQAATGSRPVVDQYSVHTVDMGKLFGKVYPEFTSTYYIKKTSGLKGYQTKLPDGYLYIRLESGCLVPYIAKYWKKA